MERWDFLCGIIWGPASAFYFCQTSHSRIAFRAAHNGLWCVLNFSKRTTVSCNKYVFASDAPTPHGAIRGQTVQRSRDKLPSGAGVERLDVSFHIRCAGTMTEERAEDQFRDDRVLFYRLSLATEMGLWLDPVTETSVTCLQLYSRQAAPSTGWHGAHSCSCRLTGASWKRCVGIEGNEESRELEKLSVPEYLSVSFYTIISKHLKNSLFHTNC